MYITKEKFRDWLLDNYFAEEIPGYGHATAEAIADKFEDDWINGDN